MLRRLFGKSRSPEQAVWTPAPSVPEGVRVFAVGDIHGRADLLSQLRDRVSADVRDRRLDAVTIFLGDYVDRGPQSRHVLDMLSARAWPTRIVALRGNHEQAFLSFIADPVSWGEWQHYGALPTLASYGIDVGPLMRGSPAADVLAQIRDRLVEALPPSHVSFMLDASDWTTAGDYFFCHAGVRPGIPLDQQEKFDLMTIREPFLSSELDFGKIVVHGHTPQEVPCVRANRIGIDTGAYATGRLTALVLEGDTQRWLSTGLVPQGHLASA